MLDQLQTSIRTVADRLAASVVSIGRDGRGSGLVIGADQVLTNIHNVRSRTVQVAFTDGRTEQGQVVATDPDGDLVVLDVPTGDAPAVEWGTPPGLGDAVVAVSRGGFRTRVTVGFVSALDAQFRGPRGRRIDGSIEHTAPLARGASGGAIADTEGRVVGINTHRVGEGFYLARPADAALQERITALRAGRSVVRPTLGVALAPAHVAKRLRSAVGLPERDGLLVRGVRDDSPGARAGLQQGDLIVAVNDGAIASLDELHRALDGLADGASIELTILRGTDERRVTVEPVREEQ